MMPRIVNARFCSSLARRRSRYENPRQKKNIKVKMFTSLRTQRNLYHIFVPYQCTSFISVPQGNIPMAVPIS